MPPIFRVWQPGLAPAMPTTAPTGWRYAGGVDFDVDAPVGTVGLPGVATGPYGSILTGYPPEWAGPHGIYDNAGVLTVSGGSLVATVFADAAGLPHGAAVQLRNPARQDTDPMVFWPDVRIEVCLRMVGASKFGLAVLLWGEDGNPRIAAAMGEQDFPEGPADGRPTYFGHARTPPYGPQIEVEPGVEWSEWHVYSHVWTPSRYAVELDGVEVARVVDRTHVPAGPHRFVVQLGSHSTTDLPPPGTGSRLELAWYRVLVSR